MNEWILSSMVIFVISLIGIYIFKPNIIGNNPASILLVFMATLIWPLTLPIVSFLGILYGLHLLFKSRTNTLLQKREVSNARQLVSPDIIDTPYLDQAKEEIELYLSREEC